MTTPDKDPEKHGESNDQIGINMGNVLTKIQTFVGRVINGEFMKGPGGRIVSPPRLGGGNPMIVEENRNQAEKPENGDEGK